MGITRSSLHKRRATGAKRKHWRKARKYELGRPAANTKLSAATAVRTVRVRGGNKKFRALRLDHGNFSWGSEAISRKTRVLDVVYNASNNELVRTKTLVKNAIVSVDANPFKQWFTAHYGHEVGKTEVDASKKVSQHVARKLKARNANKKVSEALAAQFETGRLFAAISSRPGQVGRVDGYILEGKELDFYLKRMQKKKGAAKA